MVIVPGPLTVRAATSCAGTSDGLPKFPVAFAGTKTCVCATAGVATAIRTNTVNISAALSQNAVTRRTNVNFAAFMFPPRHRCGLCDFSALVGAGFGPGELECVPDLL